MTREEITVAIESAEHALENAYGVVEAEELHNEITRLNSELRKLNA